MRRRTERLSRVRRKGKENPKGILAPIVSSTIRSPKPTKPTQSKGKGKGNKEIKEKRAHQMGGIPVLTTGRESEEDNVHTDIRGTHQSIDTKGRVTKKKMT